jgi:archaellum component FlaC
MGLAQRIVDFRNQVTFEYVTLSLEQTKKGAEEQATFFSHLEALRLTIPKMLEIYGNIRNDIIKIFEKTDPQVNNLPKISNVEENVFSYLQQLNVSLGQLFGYVLGKWFETSS